MGTFFLSFILLLFSFSFDTSNYYCKVCFVINCWGPGLHKLYFSCTRFCACKTVLGSHPCTWEIVHLKEWTYRLLTITWYGSRNCTKLVLKPLAAKNNLLLSCILLLSCRLYYFSLHDDYPPFLQIVKYTVYLHSATIFDKLKWEPV